MQAISRIIIVILLIGLIAPVNIVAQENVSIDSAAIDTTVQDTSKSGAGGGKDGKKAPGLTGQTVLDLLGTAQEIGYLLIFVFVLGVLFVLQQWFVLNREKADAAKIPIDKIRTYTEDDIKKMFTTMEDKKGGDGSSEGSEKVPLLRRIFRRKKAAAFQLLFKLYKIYDTQKSTAGFSDEISSFKQYLKDLFNPFLTRLAFLSDTAGGLGLLGTVWGMFLVFYKGSPDQNEILSGMGVALSTTIIGLVISILLNSLATVVSNLFDSHLDRIDKLANVFQDRLMKEELKRPPVPIQVVGATSSGTVPTQPVAPEPIADVEVEEQPVMVKKPQARPKVITKGEPADIKMISGDNQTAIVNSMLPEPIVVEIRDDDDNLLEGETVVFTAEEGSGTFPNGSREQRILTNEEGLAETQFKLSRRAGEKSIRISLERNKNLNQTLLAFAKPTPPEKLIEIKGNYQTGEMDRRLPEPFIVGVYDKFDNPILQHSIKFNLRKGSGRFQDSDNSHFSTLTNEDGRVEVYFIMGNNRGSREIEIEASHVEPSRLTYEVFAS